MLSRLLSSVCRKRYVPSKGWKVMTSKDYPKLNKGKGGMKAGFLDKWSNFHVVESMRPEYKVPDLKDFKLKPYVVRQAKKYPSS